MVRFLNFISFTLLVCVSLYAGAADDLVGKWVMECTPIPEGVSVRGVSIFEKNGDLTVSTISHKDKNCKDAPKTYDSVGTYRTGELLASGATEVDVQYKDFPSQFFQVFKVTGDRLMMAKFPSYADPTKRPKDVDTTLFWVRAPK